MMRCTASPFFMLLTAVSRPGHSKPGSFDTSHSAPASGLSSNHSSPPFTLTRYLTEGQGAGGRGEGGREEVRVQGVGGQGSGVQGA